VSQMWSGGPPSSLSLSLCVYMCVCICVCVCVYVYMCALRTRTRGGYGWVDECIDVRFCVMQVCGTARPRFGDRSCSHSHTAPHLISPYTLALPFTLSSRGLTLPFKARGCSRARRHTHRHTDTHREMNTGGRPRTIQEFTAAVATVRIINQQLDAIGCTPSLS
jgi:hypothetical protein